MSSALSPAYSMEISRRSIAGGDRVEFRGLRAFGQERDPRTQPIRVPVSRSPSPRNACLLQDQQGLRDRLEPEDRARGRASSRNPTARSRIKRWVDQSGRACRTKTNSLMRWHRSRVTTTGVARARAAEEISAHESQRRLRRKMCMATDPARRAAPCCAMLDANEVCRALSSCFLLRWRAHRRRRSPAGAARVITVRTS